MERRQQEILLRTLMERAHRTRENPIRFWKPHVKQETFLSSPARRRLSIWANQTGKTTKGAIEALSHAYGYRIWAVPDLELVERPDGTVDFPPREVVPEEYWVRNAAGSPIQVPNTGFVVTGLAARRGLGEVIWPKLKELLPARMKTSNRWLMGGVPANIELPNGSIMTFGSGEQQDLNTEGVTVHWAWVDEPIPQRIYAGLWRGLVRNLGRIWFTLTPLGTKAAWLYHDLIEPAQRGELDGVFVSHASMRDNPYLSEQAIKDFEEDPSYGEAERRARLFGEFEVQSLRVWPAFRRAAPYVLPYRDLPSDWPRMHVVDPHTARPWAMIWVAIDPQGWKWIYREWPDEDYTKLKSSDMTYGHYATLIREIEGRTQPTWRVMDPNFGVQRRRSLSGSVDRSIQEEMADYGLQFDCRVDDGLERGILAVADAIRYNDRRPAAPDNHPRIVVLDNCPNTVAAMLNAGYLEAKTPQRKTEKMSEEFKDFADLVRYAEVYERPQLGRSYSYFEGGPSGTLGDDDE